LRLSTDEQPAGLIDDPLRAAMLSARFLIADLSHGSLAPRDQKAEAEA